MDAYKDYVDIDAEAPPAEASSAYSGYVDVDSLEEAKPAEKSSGMGYLDTAKGAVAGAAGDVAAGLTGVQVAAEKANLPTVARVARAGSMGLHRAEEAINESITPEGRAAQGAALIPEEGQEQLGSHPFREAAMKVSSAAAPIAVGAIGGTLGGMLAGPAGVAAGTYGAGALYGLAKGVDQAVAWTNDLNDEDLAKEAPVFSKFKQMYLEENIGKGMDQQAADKQASYDARVALHDGLYGIKQAAFDAGTNALAFGSLGKAFKSSIGGSALTDYVLSGVGLGAVSASGDVNQQNVEITKKGEGQVDPFKTAIAFLNGTAEGVAFHGAGEGAKKLASWAGFKKTEAPAVDEKQVVNTPDSAAPSTGEVPKGARTGEAPKPNEAAQEGEIGNTVNPPTRDQEAAPADAKAKKTSKRRGKKTEVEATVTVLDESAPPPAETQALQQSTPGAPDTVQLAEPPQPTPIPEAVAPAPVTPEVTAPEISPKTEVPEAAPTIEAQVTDFFDKKRDVIRFNNADQVPADKPTGVRQHQGSDGSVWWHRPRKVPQGKIEQSIKAKTENELLGLGPFNKEEVAADIATGGQELAAVARDENGVEVAAAGTTDRLAPETLKAVQEANPDKTVTLEQPQQVIEGRLNGTGAVEAPVVEPAPVAKPKGRGRKMLDVATDVAKKAVTKGKAKVEEVKAKQARLKELASQLPSEEAVRSELNAAASEARATAGFKEREAISEEEAYARDVKLWGKKKADKLRAPVEAPAPREPRILRATTKEALAREQAITEETIRRQKANEASIKTEEKRIEKLAAGPQAGKKSVEEKAARRAGNEKARQLVEGKNLPNKVEDGWASTGRGKAAQGVQAARQSIVDRADRMVFEATEAGYEIPDRFRTNVDAEMNHNASAMLLDEARRLVQKVNKAGKIEKKFVDQFVKSERLLRAGKVDEYLATRREQGDAAMKKQQADVETQNVEEAPAATTDATVASGKNEAEELAISRLDEDTATKADEDFEDRLRAAPAPAPRRREFKVLTPEERAAVKARQEAEAAAALERNRRRAGAAALQNRQRGGWDTVSKSDLPAMVSVRRPEPGDFDRGGERPGRVSVAHGPDAPTTRVLREVTVEEMFRDVRIPVGGVQGVVFPILRRRLMQTVGKMKVYFVDGGEFQRLAEEKYGPLNGTIEGMYKWREADEGGYIIMSRDIPKGDVSRIFLHETMHAATEDALRYDLRFRETVWDIMDEVAEARPDLIPEYGMRNHSEFIAEAFSNRQFQQALANVKVSDTLAKQLGLQKPSMWQTLVTAIRKALNMEPGHYTALEALIRPVDEIMRANNELLTASKGGELRPFIRDAAKDMIDRFDGSNLKDLYGRFKRGASSNTMLAMMGQKLGPKFGYFARKAVDLQQQMAVRTDNLLRRKGGGLELVRKGDELRKNADTAADMDKAFDLGFKAREYNLDMTPGAKNEHIFGTSAKSDILNATQAKKAYRKLRAEIDALHPDVKDWLEKSAKFFREEDNNRRQAVIKRVLETTDVDKELAAAVVRGDISKADGTVDALAQRIFDGKMTEKDAALFKTNTIVKHLNEVANLKRLKGWYFPQEREGDYVLSARKDFATPASKHIYRVMDKNGQPTNTVIFTDPAGRKREAPARRAAQDWMQQLVNDGMLAEAKKVYVLESDPTKVISNAEANAIGAPATFKAYKVEVMDEYFDLFKDPKSRNAKAAELEKQGWGKIVQTVRQQNPNARFDGLVPSQVETMINSLQRRDKFTKLSDAAQAELIQSLRQATIKLLPGSRIQHHNLQSRNVAGYSKDMINVLAKSAQESARFQAKTELQPKINDALTSMKDEIDLDKYSKKTEERQQILRDLETRLTQGSGVSHEGFFNKALDTLNKVSLIDKLFGPSFHFINAQEPWTTAAPIIGGRHGFVRTVKTMKDAYNMIGGRVNAVMPGLRDTGKAIAGEKVNFSDYRANFKAEIAKNVGGERANRLSELLDYLHDRNLFGHEAGMEVARLADPGGAKWEQALDRIDLVSRQFGQAVEAINRSVTALSAYELEFSRTKNHQGAMRYAHDVVHDTMGNYSASNSAPAFNHPVGRAMLQFKKFAQKTYFLLGKTMGKAYEGDKEAQKALLGVLFTHGVVAGALGLPIEPIKAAVIASNALGVSPYSWDEIEAAIREEAAQMFGKKAGMALTRGVPRAFLGYDASGRQGMADLMTGLGPRSNKSSDIKNWLFDSVMGPSLSMPFKWMEGAQGTASAVAKGDYYKAAEKATDMVPIKFIRDIGRAGFGAAGGRQDKTGREVMAPYTPAEALLQAAGLTPSRRAEEGEMRSKFIGAEQKRNQDRRGLIAEWVNATPEGKRDAMSSIQQYNQSVPGNAKIKQADLVSALKRRKTEKAHQTYDRGMRITKQNRDIHDRMNQVYGD